MTSSHRDIPTDAAAELSSEGVSKGGSDTTCACVLCKTWYLYSLSIGRIDLLPGTVDRQDRDNQYGENIFVIKNIVARTEIMSSVTCFSFQTANSNERAMNTRSMTRVPIQTGKKLLSEPHLSIKMRGSARNVIKYSEVERKYVCSCQNNSF